MLIKRIINQKCQFINLQRGISVTRTWTLTVHVIRIFFLPVWSQFVNLKKKNDDHGHLRYTKSKWSANSLPVWSRFVNLEREITVKETGYLKVHKVSTFYASTPPFMEKQIVIRRLLSEHEVWLERMFEVLLTPVSSDCLYHPNTVGLFLSSSFCLQGGCC